MLGVLRKLSIKLQLLMLVTCTVTIVILLFIMTYSNIANVMEKKNNDYSAEIFSQIKRNIVGNYDLLSTMLTNAAYIDSNDVLDFMTEKNDRVRYQYFRKVDSLLCTMQRVKSEDILDFVILGDNGNRYFLHGLNATTLKFLKSLPQESMTNYYSGEQRLVYSGVEKNCFVIVLTIREKTLSKRIGIMAIVVDAKLFSFEDKNLSGSSTMFYLIDRNNHVYSSNDTGKKVNVEDILKNTDIHGSGKKNIAFGNSKYIINYEGIPETGGLIMSIAPESELFKELFWIRKLAFSMLALTLLLLSIPFAVIINNILQPLKKFMNFMNNSLKSGNLKSLKQRINLKGYSEIEIVSGEFNNMLDEIDGLTHRLVKTGTRLYEAELEKKQAELMYLRSQINPHFLYNTLELMVATGYDENAERTVDMIMSLITIFRYSVKGNDIVALEEEINIISAYIKIQQARFPTKLEVIMQFDEETLKCKVPKIILQPIVENAFFHGLETKIDMGHLWIGSEFKENGNLHIWVNDDGVGMEPDKLNSIRKSMEQVESGSYSGNCKKNIGIVNVSNRIKLIYGPEYGINIDSEPGIGTNISIIIPAEDICNV